MPRLVFANTNTVITELFPEPEFNASLFQVCIIKPRNVPRGLATAHQSTGHGLSGRGGHPAQRHVVAEAK